MTTKLNWKAKVLSAAIVTVMAFNMSALPLGSLSTLSENISGTPPSQSQEKIDATVGKNDQIPEGVDQITLPSTDKNPYSPLIENDLYPILNDNGFEYMSGGYTQGWNDLIKGYGVHEITLEGYSPYYLAAITPWFSYMDMYTDNVEGTLPYREGEREMLFPGMVLNNKSIVFHLSPNSTNDIEKGSFKDITSSYMTDKYGIDKDQVYVRVGATVLSGSGIVDVQTKVKRYTLSKTVTDGEPIDIYVDVPLTEIDSSSTSMIKSFGDSGSVGGVVTNIYVTLIDTQSPTLQNAKLDMVVNEDTGRADLVVEMQFNEGVRYVSEGIGQELDDMWIELELVDLSTNNKNTARLYFEKLEQSGKIVFRGDIGYYHYKNFRVNRISKVNLSCKNHEIQRSFIDLANEFYASAYHKLDYDNRIFTEYDELMRYGLYFKSTAIVDQAGNTINEDSIVNWQFGNQTNISNTFEAREVRLFNEITLKNNEALAAGKKVEAELTDQFVGPSRSLTAYVYLKDHLTDEEISKIWITFNILDKNGEMLTATPTSWGEYKLDELYAHGVTTGTLIRFENVRLEEGMTFIEGGDGSTVRVTGMYDDIPDRTAYPYLPESITDIYADFDAPQVSLQKYAAYSNTAEPDEGVTVGDHYKVSIKINVKDDDHLERFAGLIGSRAFVKLGAGIERETKVRYVLGDNPEPPEGADGYTGEAVLSQGGYADVGSATLINNSTDIYLHLLIESEGVQLDDLYVDVHVEDAVGNRAAVDPTGTVDYSVDGVAPDIAYEYITSSAVDENTKIELRVGVSAADIGDVVQMLYYWDKGSGDEPPASAEWSPLVFERGTAVSAEVARTFGDELSSAGTEDVYRETLWIKAIDQYGNESEPISIPVALSIEKPSTNMRFEGDYNAVSRDHAVIVKGPEASVFDNSDAYTRVSITPINQSSQSSVTSYVTLIKTGEEHNVLSFKGLTWYRVTRVGDYYVEVSDPETVGEDYVLTEDSIMYGLFTYYGEIKISFENGYGSMLPIRGEAVYDSASSGSYYDDPNYLTLRFASHYDTDRVIHSVDFGAIIDRDDRVVVENADKGADPYLYYADTRGVNPMRNSQIHFSLSNVAQGDFGMLDLDFEGSYAELYRVGDAGSEDELIATMMGLAASDSQYFTIFNTGDDGRYFVSGAYYLKVTVKSLGGHLDVYESSRVVLDAEIGETSGVWQYSTQNYASLESIIKGTYSWSNHFSENKPFESIGVSVTVGGEILRNRMFASYTYGVSGLSVILTVPDSEKTYEGVTVGKVAGYRIWNLLSEPTAEELEAEGFKMNSSGNYLSAINGLTEIYTEENIPKGADGFNEMYLVKGVNTICYQVLMENGYVSPIRQFNITVSEYTPELNVAIESYQPSHVQSENQSLLNVDHIRYFIESAYSLNGSGNVAVEVWSDYGMYVGISDGNDVVRSYAEDPSYLQGGELGLLNVPGELKVGDYVELTENSYTSDFPYYTHLCTALFVARDEYGGITIVAPQIGDERRIDVSGGIYGWEVYSIDYYGNYYDDPYLIDDDFLSWRRIYNQPSYFGRQLLGFESYIEKNTESGGEKYRSITDGAASLEYNLFNIVTNDISWGLPEEDSRYYDFGDYYYRPYTYVAYDDGENYELIYWDGATITFTGGDLGNESVTLDLKSGDKITNLSDGVKQSTPNSIGYLGASVFTGSDGVMRFTFEVAYPQANASNPAGTQVKRQYEINCLSKYGDSYVISGEVTLYYIDYELEAVMEDNGANLYLSFITREHSDSYKTGKFNCGQYSFTATDHYGNKVELTYSIAEDFDRGTRITLSELQKTPGPVTVTLQRDDGVPIYVDITDYEIMSVDGNGTSTVKVTLTDSTRFSYRYLDPESVSEIMNIIDVDNIKKPNPKVIWSYSESTVLEDENGNRYKYGEVTAYLIDENYLLIDKFTGKAPSFTFTPNGENSYVFDGSQIIAVMGEYEIDLEKNYAALLSISLYELPDPLGLDKEDTETPNVQILTYAEQNGYYLNSNVAIRLEAATGQSSLPKYSSYTVLEFLGDRVNTARALEAIGWGTSFRFEIQTEDSSRVKLFIKEGLYAEAPDYERGYSDTIPGVQLNSKLLTVTQNAAFSLFVVDAYNNAVSIAFDVNNIGEAPVPRVVKVDKGNGAIRGYLIPPDGVTGFEIVGGQNVKIDSDSPIDSEYFGRYYVEYTKNDDYVVNYRFTYNERSLSGEIRVSVTEIMLDEIALIDNNQPIWSANKANEATPHTVTATATLTKEIKEIKIVGDYDEKRVSFFVSSNTLTASFSDNHPAVEIRCYDAAGNFVTVRFDAVENIDKSAPIVNEVSRSLSENGRELLLTLSSNERALFKEGGYIGEQITDGNGNTLYYYTRTITQNGNYSYSFTDMSGLITTIEITVTEIVSEPLEVLYSTSFDGTDVRKDPSELNVMIGDKIFVKPNRDATLEMSGGAVESIKAGEWNEIVIPEALGGILPYVIITDSYGNVLTHQFSAIKVPDTTPPDIVVLKKIYSIRVGTTRAEIEAALLQNFNAFDDLGGDVTLSVRFTENINVIGVTEVEYTAADSEGNSATVKEKLRITSIYEPVVKYGDIKLDRGDGAIVAAGEELKLVIDCNGAPYTVKIKAGNRTEAQMKDGEAVTGGYTTADTVSFGKLEKGIYTICIITQERDYFKIIISVE